MPDTGSAGRQPHHSLNAVRVSRNSVSKGHPQALHVEESAMNQEQLMDRLCRLKRKLAATHEAWHSGRVDCLVDALRRAERELRVRQAEAAPVEMPLGLIRLH
jgi:hypothetical protein